MSARGEGEKKMNKHLLEAALIGNTELMNKLASRDQSVLLGLTPENSNCLHISAAQGHNAFCVAVSELNHSLLANTNFNRETPLLAAVKCNHSSLASVLFRFYIARGLRDAILCQDRDECNTLHYAIRGGYENFALELIRAVPDLSKHKSKSGESTLFIAVMRNFTGIALALLAIDNSLDCGHFGRNSLHAAVRNGNEVIAKKIMKERPLLALEATRDVSNPVCMAVYHDKIDMLRVLLEHDSSLGYVTTKDGCPLLQVAAYGGHVGVARELLKHCPDAPYRGQNDNSSTCLHTAVRNGFVEFVDFILMMPQLRMLANMRDGEGKTALHIAVNNCNDRIVEALLPVTDTTVVDDKGSSAVWELSKSMGQAKTLSWNKVFMLMLRADSRDASSIQNLHSHAKRRAIDSSRKNVKALTKTYSSSTLILGIFIATITFAAIVTVPGGYSSTVGSEGLPIMYRKVAFQAFVVSDVTAFCASFIVSFICILARWEDYESLNHYRSSTQALLWIAVVAASIAFSTCLYALLAPHLDPLAIGLCALVSLLPILIWLVGTWPILKVRYRLGKSFDSKFLEMV